MLGKLIRHEFHATSRWMLPMYLITLLLSGFSRILLRVVDNPGNTSLLSGMFVRTLSGVVTALSIISLIVVTFFAVILMIYRFYKNLMTDEGYLMFTLPVNVHQLLWAKLLVSAVWFIGTILLDVLGVLILTWSSRNTPEFFRSAWEVLRQIGSAYPTDLLLFLLESFVGVLLAMLVGCLVFYTPISIGHSFDNHKILLSVVFYFVLQFIGQIMGIYAVINGFDTLSRIDVPNGTETIIKLYHAIFASGILAEIVIGAALYFVTWLMLRKRLNLQ